MPYIGDTPTTTSFAAVVKDAFSGDGSETAFTLSKIATTNSVAVFVENVRQEPTTAYAVSGTTLTFTAAPVSSSGNNIYVVHMNPTATATHPAAQNLTAVNGTLTGTLAVTGTSTLTGNVTASADLSVGDDLTLGSDASVLNFGADSDVSLTHVADTGLLLNSTRQLQFNDSSQYINAPSATVLDINATDEIELNATAVDLNGTLDVSGTLGVAGVSALTNKLTVLAADGAVDNEFVVDIRNDEATNDRSFGLRVAAGSTTTDRALDVQNHAMDTVLLRVNGAGHVSMPLQPAFRGQNFTAGVATNGTTGYSSGHSHYKCTTIKLNVGSHYDNTNGIFTCPTDGVYYAHLQFARNSEAWTAAAILHNTTLITMNWLEINSVTSGDYETSEVSSLINASANDKIYFTYANAYTAPSNSGNNTDMNIWKVS